jgi:hypothetical protein
VLADEAGRVWVLGFAAFAERPVLTDLARLERDLLQRGAAPSPAFDRLAARLHRGDPGEAWLLARLLAALDADAWDDATRLAAELDAAWASERVLHIAWLAEGLGVAGCPGRRDRGRTLEDDLTALAEAGVTRVVSLVTAEERAAVGCGDLADAAESFGIAVVGVDAAGELVAALDAGERVVIVDLDGGDRAREVAAAVIDALES